MDIAPKKQVALIACLAVFLSAPYVPNSVLRIAVNSYVGVAALLVAALVAVRYDMIIGLAVFLAAGALFLENRKRLVAGEMATSKASAPVNQSTPAPVETLDEPAEPVVETEVHPAFETPSRESHSFKPSDDDHSDVFKPVGESINDKEPLEVVPSNSSQKLADMFEREGLGH